MLAALGERVNTILGYQVRLQVTGKKSPRYLDFAFRIL
jgi:hypothetical protein